MVAAASAYPSEILMKNANEFSAPRSQKNGCILDDFAYQKQYDTVLLCLLYTSPSPRDGLLSRMPSSA